MTKDAYHILEIGDIIQAGDECQDKYRSKMDNTVWEMIEEGDGCVGTKITNLHYPFRRKVRYTFVEESITAEITHKKRKITV